VRAVRTTSSIDKWLAGHMTHTRTRQMLDACAATLDSEASPRPVLTPLPSLSDAARLPVSPQASTFLDQPAALGVGGARTPDDTPDPNRPIAINITESYHRPRQPASLAPNIPVDTLRREPDVQHGTGC
jgi:hypothetical protein